MHHIQCICVINATSSQILPQPSQKHWTQRIPSSGLTPPKAFKLYYIHLEIIQAAHTFHPKIEIDIEGFPSYIQKRKSYLCLA